jgi:hypothetical protein
MAEFAAHTYPVGGLYTHGGDIETHYDNQPRDLIVCWDQDDREWHLTACPEHDETCWVPFETDGPTPDGRHCDWNGQLQEFGPVWDGLQEPAREPDWAWV